MYRLKVWFTAHKTTAILVAALFILLVGGYITFQKINPSSQAVEEIDLPFDPEGPYALLHPRRDGNALILILKRTASYDSISYELAYTSKVLETAIEGGGKILDEGEEGKEGVIDRGVVGTIDTKEKKGEYEQEILFGTCSKNVCKYDQGVENGTLTLRIKKGNKLFKMVTLWHLQQPDVALGVLTSGDGHFSHKLDVPRETLSSVGFTIINDLSGMPKLPQDMEVLGKVYSVNLPIAKELPGGGVSVELAENPPADAKLYRFKSSENKWEELGTRIDGSKLSAKANGDGIFAVLTSKR